MANLLATCATKLTVNGTTTAPEHLMVCGSARFVNSSAHDIYMGTSNGSVDISFQRAASQDFKIRTYSGGWNDALRILGTCVYACTCLQSPLLCAPTCIRTPILCADTRVNTTYVCINGQVEVRPFSTDGLRGVQIRSGCTSNTAALELTNNSGTWMGTLYTTTGHYGFLDSSWGNWDIKKAIDGTMCITVGSSGFVCALEGGVCATTCVSAPVVCATTCLRADNQDAICLTHSNPYIRSGSSYIIMPNGLYVSGGTLYVTNTINVRSGICQDNGTILDIFGGNDSHKCTNLRGKTFVCQCLYVHCNICLAPDTSGNMQNGISLGKVGGLPQAAWGESGTQTGRIEIGLPTKNGEGGSSHLGMVHVAVDVYEYNGNDVMTFIVGGHNWACQWYNCGAHITGGCTDKTIKLAYHACGGTCNGRYVILIGEPNSSWTYGSVHVRSITNGLYYCDYMDMGTPWYVKRVTCADNHYNQTTGDLRPTSFSMAGYQCAMTCVHAPTVCATTCVSAPRVCATTDLISPLIYPTGCLQFDQPGTRSWKVCASSGNLNFHSGDGSGVFYFHNQTNSNIFCGTTCVKSAILCSDSNIVLGNILNINGMCLHKHDGHVLNYKSANSSVASIRFQSSDGTTQGYTYFDSKHMGFLDADGQWMYYGKCDSCHNWRINNNTQMILYGACLCHCAKIEAAILCAPTCLSSSVVKVSNGTNISSSAGATGQFIVSGLGYSTFIAMDGSNLDFGHNSSARGLRLMTNESVRMCFSGDGSSATITTSLLTMNHLTANGCICASQHMCASHFYGDGSNLTGISGSGVSGSGTDQYVPRFNGTGAVENSAIYSNDSNNVGLGTTSVDYKLHVVGIVAAQDGVGAFRIIGTAGTASIIDLKADGGIFKIRDVNSGSEKYHIKTGSSGYHKWYVHDSLKMALCSNGILYACSSVCVGNTLYVNGGSYWNNACLCLAVPLRSTCICSTGGINADGYVYKGGGGFLIKHPNPAKCSTHTLMHGFVESNTRGDNIYRWQVETSNCTNVITLPEYNEYLNENEMTWVSPVDHFGRAYGEVTADRRCIVLCSDTDGKYNVMLVGTRKDPFPEDGWIKHGCAAERSGSIEDYRDNVI